MENNVIEKAEYLKETKNLIKQALQEQGADISDTDPFRAFASIISNLKTSSGDDAIKIKTGEEIDNMTSEDTLICICSKEYSYTDYDGILVEYKRGIIYEVINGSANKLLFDTDTTNYRDLDSKPSINGVELVNNKSLTELGIQPKGDYALKKDLPRNTSELNNDAGYLTEYTETDPTVPDYVKNITQEEIEKWNTPFEELDPTVPQHVKDITEDDIDKWNASEDYKNLKNKPLINGVELNENKSLEDLGIQPKGEYITEETDPTIPQYIKNITEEDIARWNSGGDVDIEETDPTVPQHVKDITEEDIAKWNSGIGSGSSVNVDALPIGSVLLYNGDEIPEGYIELEDYEPTYSIEEKVIGTWIDGRPIYRKVIVTTTPSTENSWVDVAIGVDNIKEYIRYDAKFETSGLTYFADIFEDSTHKFMAVAKSNAIAMLVGSSGWCSKPVTLILEYTKTTD